MEPRSERLWEYYFGACRIMMLRITKYTSFPYPFPSRADGDYGRMSYPDESYRCPAMMFLAEAVDVQHRSCPSVAAARKNDPGCRHRSL